MAGQMNVLSLFSGIGGLDLGLERAGMTVVGQVEIDPWCRTILAKHWPEVPRHDDVRTAAGWWGDRAVDLVCGGFPCQPVSSAGKKLAQADSRWLWPAFADVIRQLRPRYALMENVPGLLGRGLGDVLGDLASLGYDAEWDCVPAAFVGAPHIRSRVFVVAYPASGGTAAAQQPGRVRGVESGCADVADAASSDDWRRFAETSQRSTREPRSRPVSADVPDPDSALHGHRHDAARQVFEAPTQGHEGRRAALRDPGQWPAEPGVGRVAHGIPRRVDRLRGLGNAVVPQVAQHIGRLIMAALETAA